MTDADPPALDVVIPSAAPAQAVDETLHALLLAARPVRSRLASITLVDDAVQRAASVEVASEVSLVRTSGAVGSGAARNLGAREGDAPWVVFLDDDVTLDTDALQNLVAAVATDGADAFVGALRPPPGVPRWIEWAYEDGTMTPVARAAEQVPAHRFASALCCVRREAFERAGGFPELGVWGHEDPLLGLALERLGLTIVTEPGVSGIHRYEPTWEAWLRRRETSGRRYADLEAHGLDVGALIEGSHLRGGPRSYPKRAAGRLPVRCLQLARGRRLRRLAAAGAEARGYRLQMRSERSV